MGILKVVKSKDGEILEETQTDFTEKKGSKIAKRKTSKKVKKAPKAD